MNQQRAFTLIELLVVVSIIGLLASVVMASLTQARDKAKIAKARSEMQQLEVAVTLLANDTGLNPGPGAVKYSPGNCYYPPDPNDVYLDSPAGGISATDGNFPRWSGPYMQVPLDPWGSRYVFDEDYYCTGNPVGCTGINPLTYHRAIVSSGPNKSAPNIYDADNVVRILCVR